MRPHQRMFILHRLPPHHPSPLPRESRLLKATMHRLQAMQALLQALTQAIIRLDLARKQGIPTNLGAIKQIQKRNPGGLFLIRHIRVPGHAAVAAREEGLEVRRAGRRETVHDVEFRMTLGRAGCGVDVVTAEEGTELQRALLWQVGEILVAEGDDLALGDEQRELCFAGFVERGQLYAVYFGADGGGEVLDFGTRWEQVGVAWVGVFSVFDVVELF